MKRTLKLKSIRWDDKFIVHAGKEEKPAYPGVDGAVEYEITQEYSPEELTKILKPGEIAATEQELDRLREANAPHQEFAKIGIINPYAFTVFQPFSRKGTYKQDDAGYVWAWDGNKDAPTLTPSFLMDWQGSESIRIHLFFTAGRINLLSDSNVELIS